MKKLISIIVSAVIFTSTPVLAEDVKSIEEGNSKQINLIPLAGTEQVQLNLVNCGWFLDCKLAKLLLPASAFSTKWELQFDNPNLTSVNVLNSKIVIKGSKTNYQLISPTIELPQAKQSLPANQIVDLPLTWKRDSMPPDNYTGAIYLTLAEQNNRLNIPVNLNVRSGPFIPLLVLFFGVILGRIFKYMQERGEPQAEVLQQVNRLQEDIENAPEEDKKILTPMIDQARQAVYREKFEQAEVRIKAIEARFELLTELRTLETNLKGKEQHPVVKEAMEKITQARQSLILNNESEAKKILEEVRTDIPKLTSLMGSSASDEGISEKLEQASKKALDSINRSIEAEKDLAPISNGWKHVQSFLIIFSGVSDQVRAEATFWIVRPLLGIILLIGLSIVGIGSLYVENGKTFGSNPFPDYLGLVLWGLSADVASRSLSSLQSEGEKAKL